MINTRNAGLDQARTITTAKPPANGQHPDKTGTPGHPHSPGSPTNTQVVANLAGAGKLGHKTGVNSPATQPGAAPSKGTKGSKPKESPSASTSSRAAARRQEHTNAPVAMPAGQERGKGGGSGGSGFASHQDGRQEMHEWMPVSAQQSRISRASARPSMPHSMGLPKTGVHALHGGGLETSVMSMLGKFYMDVLPSLFRRTPQDLGRNHARRQGGSDVQVNTNKPERKRAMAGDLSTSFASA